MVSYRRFELSSMEGDLLALFLALRAVFDALDDIERRGSSCEERFVAIGGRDRGLDDK